MSFTPKVVPMNVMRQGANTFLYPSQWNDVIQASSSATTYNLTTARSNMALHALQPLFVIFAADGPFWVNFFATAVIPVGNNTDGNASEYYPNQRYIDESITNISIVAASACNVCMQFFRP